MGGDSGENFLTNTCFKILRNPYTDFFFVIVRLSHPLLLLYNHSKAGVIVQSKKKIYKKEQE